MAKKALCVGINSYDLPDQNLTGCTNDANAWLKLLVEHYDFPRSDVRLMVDSEATRAGILGGLQDLFAGARPGDVLVFANSSHGSYVVDRGGDETFDQVLCPHDISTKDIKDDDLRGMFADLPAGVRLTVILDNCHAGTGTREVDQRRERFLSPDLRGLPLMERPWQGRPNRTGDYSEAQMKEVLLTGCSDTEKSYEAVLGGAPHGVMSYYALRVIEESNYRLTYQQLHNRVKDLITRNETRYPQHPQLEGSDDSKRRQIFT